VSTPMVLRHFLYAILIVSGGLAFVWLINAAIWTIWEKRLDRKRRNDL